MADGSQEVEWQFDAPDLEAVDRWLRAQPSHAAFALEARAPKRQRDTYFDTPDWRVFNAAYTLRVRAVGDAFATTLKGRSTRGSGPVSRAEFSVPGDLDAAIAEPSPVGRRLQLMLRGHAPAPLFTVTTHRRAWLVRRADLVIAEIALDETAIEAPGGALGVLRRVEIEEVTAGSLGALDAFVTAIRAECALTPAADSKFASGLAIAGLKPGDPDLGPTDIAADDRAVDRAYAVIRRRAAEFLAREAGAALGEDVEQLHDMRVATRRLRAALRVFDGVLPQSLMDTRDELRWFAQSLGAVRDLDVQLEHLAGLRDAAGWAEATALAPLVTQFERQHAEARTELLAAMDSDRYARLVATLRSVLLAGPQPEADDASSRDEGRRIILRRYRRFEADARALRRDSPHVQFHALRIRGKRLRYSLEFFVDLFGRSGARALTSLRTLQDLLGELQDLATTDLRLRDMVRDLPSELPADTLVMIGRLMERHEARSRGIVRSFPRARAAVLRDFTRLQRILRTPDPEPPAPEPEPEPVAESVSVAQQTAVTIIPPGRASVPAPIYPGPGRTLQSFVRFFRGRRP